MGIDRCRCRASQGGGSTLRALVVPAVASFAVDKGFRYALGDHTVQVGSLVRVPLSGRRVRGYVVAVEDNDSAGLKEVLAVSSPLPLFTSKTLESVRWAATHYVAPMATVLARTAPPNLPKATPDKTYAEVGQRKGVLGEIEAAAVGRRRSPGFFVFGSPIDEFVDLAVSVAGHGQSVLIAAPTAHEVNIISDKVASVAPDRLICVSPDLSDASVTTAWARMATRPGSIVVGTERVALWSIASLGLAIVVDEGRRSHKARQTPTIHTRDLLKARSRVEGFAFVMSGLAPTTEALAAGVRMIRSDSRRLWAPVEVVDRLEEPPGGGLISSRVRVAMAGAANRRQSVFVLVGRKGYAPAFRCVACRSLRRCDNCGTATNQAGSCQRCRNDLGPCAQCGRRRFEPLGAGIGRIVEEIRRFHDAVGPAGSGQLIAVGTERDLVAASGLALGVVVDADGMVFGTNYRSTEDALRLFARLGAKVKRESGSRLIVQTSQPSHEIFGALRRSDPLPFLEAELAERATLRYPPIGELIVVEVANPPAWAADRIRTQVEAAVLGPAEVAGRTRWLVQGDDLSKARQVLRGIVGEMRDAGANVRVDVDPIDL